MFIHFVAIILQCVQCEFTGFISFIQNQLLFFNSSVKVIDKVWDQEKKSLNLGNLRATDFRNNKRVFIPKLDDDEDEINRNFVKNELIKVVEKYKNENCDKYGNIIENNLDPKIIKTIKELKNRIKEEKLVLL